MHSIWVCPFPGTRRSYCGTVDAVVTACSLLSRLSVTVFCNFLKAVRALKIVELPYPHLSVHSDLMSSRCSCISFLENFFCPWSLLCHMLLQAGDTKSRDPRNTLMKWLRGIGPWGLPPPGPKRNMTWRVTFFMGSQVPSGTNVLHYRSSLGSSLPCLSSLLFHQLS